ncbi:patatin-like phospholipase family protein [Pseudoduganella namucuonensis]|uniref:Patatin-like phospholipase n=1 Tax=Pseudoduganella namucuonensis TaxID=1035707 RepID=A0A1I7LVA3_9BURK|nr:patatin-like phospholipase family protein [Pseudoduganella namucuonensis]SFV13618.1 Patatin-like phospholipase [Pseudoduganella namucuonensis]
MAIDFDWIPPHVLDEELRNVALRRAMQLKDGEPQPGRAAVEDSLVGLALSGGGIRSATFGLGVLEALKEQDRLHGVDYLSTVSGGGYIGAWLSANCQRAADRKAAAENNEIPTRIAGNRIYRQAYVEAGMDWLSKAANWRESVAHLRSYSNYLSPNFGIFSADSWTMLTTWIRNALLVQVTVILCIAALLLLPRLLHEPFLAWPTVGPWRWVTVVLFVTAVSGIAANHWRLTTRRDVSYLRAREWALGLTCSYLCLVALGFICALYGYDPFEDRVNSLWVSVLAAIPAVFAGLFMLPVGVRLAGPLMHAARHIIPGWITTRTPRRIDYGQGLTQALVIVPLMLTSYFLAAVMWGLTTGAHQATALRGFATFGQFLTQGWRYWPFPLAITFVALWPLSYFSRIPQKRSLWAALLAPIPAMLVLHALLSAIMLLMHKWAALPDQGGFNQGAHYAVVWGPALVLYAFSLTIVVQMGMMGRRSPEGIREWWSRLGAWMLVYGAAWMLVAVAAIFGPLWLAMALDSNWLSWSALGTWVSGTLAGLLAGNAASTRTLKGTEGEITNKGKALNAVAIVGPYVFIGGLVVGISALLHLILLHVAYDSCCSLRDIQRYYWLDMEYPRAAMVQGILAGVLAAAAVFGWRVDINVFNLNSFYRGRLSRCYLGASRFVPRERSPQRFTLFDDEDDLPMPALAGEGLTPTTGPQRAPAGPLHIVSCALNLGGSSDLSLHARHAASFSMTPYQAGSGYYIRTDCGGYQPLGYRAMAHYCGSKARPTLAQAISVSGAAASPNMGYHTSPGTAFLLTMFNVRLGWWFPNPKLAHITRPSPQFSVRYLVKELFGAAEAKSNYLMISDGGHFENLAAYELIRRKCRVVIVSDAECDRYFRFEGLGRLIRMCEIDFGVKLELDVSEVIGDNASRWGRRRFAVGRIDYGDGHFGVFIYLKASMTGKEETSVLQYKSLHEAFPHEPTGDQFYGEDQFESYRHLGRDIARSLFGEVAQYRGLVAAAEALQRKYHTHGQQPPAPSSGQRVGPNIARPAHRVHALRFVRGGRYAS